MKYIAIMVFKVESLLVTSKLKSDLHMIDFFDGQKHEYWC